jgi:hypothetical protein
VAAKRDNTGLYLLILLFFFLRLYGGKKKGIGTTLFGVGTVLDLSKPIEDIDAFIKASKEENERGFTGSIKPKGIYYLLPAGSKVYEKNKVDRDTNCPADVIAQKEKIIYRTYSSEDRKIYNPILTYLDEGENSKFLPPYVMWNSPGLTFFVLPDCGGSIIDTAYTTAERADYGNFYRIPEN